MNTSTKPTENLAECGNESKPLLADVLKLSRYSLIRAFQDNGLRVYQVYYTMSKTRLAEKFMEELDSKNIR